MEATKTPKYDLAKKVLPSPLLKALEHIFEQNIENCVLAGGTALAGFYFGHRTSDDIDLFVKDGIAFKAGIYAVRSLLSKNTYILSERTSSQYFHCLTKFEDYTFTIDIVLDEHIFSVTSHETLERNISVLSLESLLKTKIATLISRCSEKDLYDLVWLFNEYPNLNIQKLISYGSEIDKGFNAENLLIAISGSNLRKESCTFAKICNVDETKVYNQIRSLQKELCRKISEYLHTNKNSHPIEILLKNIRNKIER